MSAHKPVPENVIRLFRSLTRPVLRDELYCLMMDNGFWDYHGEPDFTKKIGWNPRTKAAAVIEKCCWEYPRAKESKEVPWLTMMKLNRSQPNLPYFFTYPEFLLPEAERIQIPSNAELQAKYFMENLTYSGDVDPLGAVHIEKRTA